MFTTTSPGLAPTVEFPDGGSFIGGMLCQLHEHLGQNLRSGALPAPDQAEGARGLCHDGVLHRLLLRPARLGRILA